jgi:hypothetical protein
MLALFFSPASSARTTPADELSDAVIRGGASGLDAASSEQLLRAYMSILAKAKPTEVIWYVNAAVKARPDLAPSIVVATLNLVRPSVKLADQRQLCQRIGDIIQAAVIAAPASAVAVVKAAIEAAPFARACILAAASAAAPDQSIAFREAASAAQTIAVDRVAMTSSSVLIPAIGTINPADYTPPGNVVSPEQPPPSP